MPGSALREALARELFLEHRDSRVLRTTVPDARSFSPTRTANAAPVLSATLSPCPGPRAAVTRSTAMPARRSSAASAIASPRSVSARGTSATPRTAATAVSRFIPPPGSNRAFFLDNRVSTKAASMKSAACSM